jgi:hypothetical protein
MNTGSAGRAASPTVCRTTETSTAVVAWTTPPPPPPPLRQPLLAAAVDSWSRYLCASLSATELADRRKIADLVDHAILHRDSNLDFRHASAAALEALPGAALKLLAQQVTGVTLPAGLDAFPRCLFRLTALRSIELATCKATQLDVTPWDLDTLTVSGKTTLRWIAANERTTVSCPAPGIRRKVCVNLYRDGKLIGHTAAGSRRYIKVPGRCPFNMNGQYLMRNGELAYCRHIAQWWVGARASRRIQKQSGPLDRASDMYSVVQSATAFRDAINDDHVIHRADWAPANGSRNNLVGNDAFGTFVESEFRRLSGTGLPAARLFRVISITHAMGLELAIKYDAHRKPDYRVVFYDPNVSATHSRLKYHCIEDARGLKLSELFPRPELISGYFGNQSPVVIVVDADHGPTKEAKKRSLRVMLSRAEAPCHLALDLAVGHKFEATSIQLIQNLRAMPAGRVDWKTYFGPRTAEDLPTLFVAVDNSLPHVVRSLLELSIELSAEGVLEKGAVFQMLQRHAAFEKSDSPVTPLSLACKSRNSRCIAVITDVLVGPQGDGLATPAEYEQFLRNGGPGQPSPFALALLQDEFDAALTMVESMLRLTVTGRITSAQFVRLFGCQDADGVSVIEPDFAAGETQIVVALMRPVINAAKATFKSWEMAEMLSAPRADGTPALRATYQGGHASFLAAYGALVLSSVARDNMHAVDAIAILLAGMPGETPVEALRAIAPHGEMLNVLVDLLHDPIVVRWVSGELLDGLDALLVNDPARTIFPDVDPDSESSSLG